jgi:outer membrane lipopolysaccharide assembly protein LptE/RlpB
MKRSIVKAILVWSYKMCDFHLKEKCFHPEKVQKGLIAISCDANNCTHCTDENWRKAKISEQIRNNSEMLKLLKQELPSFNIQKTVEEQKKFNITKIFG